jgi:hypothetical protein
MIQNRLKFAVVFAAGACLGLGGSALAGPDACPTWDTTIGNPGAPGGSVSGVDRIGDEIFIGGGFSSLGGAPNTQRWGRYNLETGQFAGLGGFVPDNFVTGFFTYDDGNGEQVYIMGSFNEVSIGGFPLANSRGMVRWDGSTITTVPNSPFTGTFDFMWDGLDYNGLLVTGGNGGRIKDGAIIQKPTFATWDGTTWTTYSDEFGGLVAPVILAMAEFQGKVYFGGRFASFDDSINPIVESNNIMRFDENGFSGVGGGVFRATSIISQVLALEVFDDGSGEKLYVGGRFDRLGSNSGIVSPAVARWDGSQWEAMPGFPQPGREVRGFEIFNGELYAVGNFETTGDGSVPARKFAKWNGTSWEEVGDGFTVGASNDNPSTITSSDDGLIIGGNFTTAGNGTGPGAGSAVGLVKWVADCDTDCPGDVTGDNMVNLADLNLVLANFGQMTSDGDANGDGVVNLADLNLVLANFGLNCAG